MEKDWPSDKSAKFRSAHIKLNSIDGHADISFQITHPLSFLLYQRLKNLTLDSLFAIRFLRLYPTHTIYLWDILGMQTENRWRHLLSILLMETSFTSLL